MIEWDTVKFIGGIIAVVFIIAAFVIFMSRHDDAKLERQYQYFLAKAQTHAESLAVELKFKGPKDDHTTIIYMPH